MGKSNFLGIVIILLLLVLVGCSSESPEAIKTDNNINAASQEENLTEPKGLGLSLNKFVTDFNNISAEFNANFSIGNLEQQFGEFYNSYQYMLNDNIGILINADNLDDNVIDVTIIARGDGSFNSGIDILLCIGVIIGVMQPELAAAERGEILKDIELDGSSDAYNLDTSTIRGQYEYWVFSSPELGIMFGVSNKDD